MERMKNISTAVIICLCITGSILSLAILQAPPFTSPWTIEIVDESTQVGLDSTIIIDSQDQLHICYFDKQQDTIKYAQWSGESWNCDYINENVRTDDRILLEIDDNDVLHLMTLHGNNPGLMYIKINNFNYAIMNHSYGSYWMSMDLNQEGQPIVLMTDFDFLLYLVGEDGMDLLSRNPDFLADYYAGRIAGVQYSLVVDEANNIHISGQSFIRDPETLMPLYAETIYAVYADGQWSHEVYFNQTINVTTRWASSKSTLLQLDSTGSPHICYYDAMDNEIRYTYKDNQDWVTETVAEGGATDISMAIDSNDNICLSYYNTSEKDLRYSQRTDNGWYSITIDEDGITGLQSSIAIDSQDNVHISYYDETNQNLMHAYRVETEVAHLYLAEGIVIVGIVVWYVWSRKQKG